MEEEISGKVELPKSHTGDSPDCRYMYPYFYIYGVYFYVYINTFIPTVYGFLFHFFLMTGSVCLTNKYCSWAISVWKNKRRFELSPLGTIDLFALFICMTNVFQATPWERLRLKFWKRTH